VQAAWDKLTSVFPSAVSRVCNSDEVHFSKNISQQELNKALLPGKNTSENTESEEKPRPLMHQLRGYVVLGYHDCDRNKPLPILLSYT